MMVRLIGAALILASSAVMGTYMARTYERRVTSTDAVVDFIRYIKRNIESFSMPVDDIISAYTSEHFEATGFLEAVRRDGLTKAISDGYLTLSGEAEHLFAEFAQRLGSDYTDGEVKRCEYYINEFEEFSTAERENLATNGRLCRLLPPLGAVSLIILLI